MEEKYFMNENSNLGTTSNLLLEYRYIYSFAYCLWLFCTPRAKVSSYEGIWPIKPSFLVKGQLINISQPLVWSFLKRDYSV